MKKFLRSPKKSQSPPIPEQVEDEPRSPSTQNFTNEETPVTNYRSFSEYRNNSRSGRSGRSGRSNNSSSTRSSTPVNLIPTHEVTLEDQRNLGKNAFRGFSSSMHDMYTGTEFERVDCCAMACGGILQSDRDRYLLQGITPPSIARRFWLHIFFPCSMFTLAACGAMSIPDRTINQIFCSGLVLMLVTYIILQCFKGRSKRIEIRKDLLWTKAQLQEDRGQNLAVLLEQQPPDDFDQDQEYYLGQTRRDFRCAHPCCILGFYGEDRQAYELRFRPSQEDEQQVTANQRQVARDSRRRNANLSRCMWDYLCPAVWCGHQVICCGICALAQEGREIESALLPASYRRIDYISMQPISHYYPAIYKQRHGDSSSRRSRRTRNPPENGTGLTVGEGTNEEGGRAERSKIILSDLSRQLIQFALTVTSLVFVWCLVGKHFWKHALNLSVPEWRIFDFTDFIVYLAAWAQAIALTAILAWFCNRPCPTHLSFDAMVKLFAAGFCLSTSLAVFWELVLGMFTKAVINLFMAIFGVNVVIDEDGYSGSWIGLGAGSFARTIAARTGDGDDFIRAFGKSHPIFYTLYIALVSFFLAAFIEETCKYFGYRMVEHPDFMSQREIEEAMTVVIQQGEDEDFDEDTEQRREELRRRQQEELDRTDFSKQKKSMQSLGGAITLSMVCVAMGFTCCENLVYIFIYSGSTIGMEISILIARSFFPIHPIAAAIQSIHIVEREVEVTRTAQLGRILLPAVLFHGMYDFCILLIDFLSNRNGNYIDEGVDFAGLLSFVVSGVIMLSGIAYYFVSAARQRSRLQVADASIESGQSVLI